MKKLLLIQPSPYEKSGGVIKKNKLYFVGLSLPLLAALTPNEWEVELIYEVIENIPFDTDADLIGISTMGHGVIRSIDIAKEYRRLGKTVILGGYMASIMPSEAIKYCDSLVIGDAELIWEEVLNDFNNKSLKRTYEKSFIGDTYSTPIPRFDLLKGKKLGDFLPVQAGRGCPNVCSFCSVSCLYKGRYVRKEIREVTRDIEQIKSLGYKKILLLDDNIFSDKDYLSKLLDEIKKLKITWMSQCDIRVGKEDEILKKLYDSGCRTLSFGLESLSRESLIQMDKGWANPKEYNKLIKNIRDHGIDVSTEMVVGGEGDTLESIKETKKFIEDNRISVPRFYILTPFPGTKFFEEIKNSGRLINHNIYSYDGTRAVYRPNNMTDEELTKSYWDLYNSLFTIKSIFIRNVLRREFLKTPFRYIFNIGVNLYYRKQIKEGITPNIF